ncbi:MAG: ArsB/NhaD family transporter [Candidatus Thermoplasmatota archaeon]|nr:ArsB/NhaD family transporter [Candidatus Thermoplasmatota archaeon]
MADLAEDSWIVLFIFIAAFALILSEKVHRTIAAWFGCVCLLIAGHARGMFNPCEEKVSQGSALPWRAGDGETVTVCTDSLEYLMLGWIHFDVIGLLLGMMVFAALLELSGFFEYIAIKASKMSGGDPWKLVVYLGTFTTLASLVIYKVTAIIIIAPVTLRICQKLEINPVPPLLAEAILSDTGGVASMVGDPPNVMIAAAAADLDMANIFGFNGFLLRLGILTFLAWVATLGYLRYYYRDWRESKPAHVEAILEEDEWDAVDDMQLMNTTLLVLAATVLMFSFTEFLHLGIEIHAIALAGAGIALVLARPKDHEMRDGLMHSVSEKIEWHALLFFAGLFILVGAMGNVGYLNLLADWIFDTFSDPIMLAVAIIWVSAIASAIVDNIPFTAAMIPVIILVGERSAAEGNPMDIAPLFWALAMGAGFGGNATPIGSSANVMAVSISERGPNPITTKEWLRVGFPVMIITCTVATIFMVLFHGPLYSS